MPTPKKVTIHIEPDGRVTVTTRKKKVVPEAGSMWVEEPLGGELFTVEDDVIVALDDQRRGPRAPRRGPDRPPRPFEDPYCGA